MGARRHWLVAAPDELITLHEDSPSPSSPSCPLIADIRLHPLVEILALSSSTPRWLVTLNSRTAVSSFRLITAASRNSLANALRRSERQVGMALREFPSRQEAGPSRTPRPRGATATEAGQQGRIAMNEELRDPAASKRSSRNARGHSSQLSIVGPESVKSQSTLRDARRNRCSAVGDWLDSSRLLPALIVSGRTLRLR